MFESVKNKTLIIVVSFIFVNSAHAMKRDLEEGDTPWPSIILEDLANFFDTNQLPAEFSLEEVADRQLTTPKDLTDYTYQLPDEVMIIILKKLTLKDLSSSFVNKKWFCAAERAFFNFYQFQKSYHECTEDYKKGISKTFILMNLRTAYAQLKANGLSDQEITALARGFLRKNFASIKATKATPLTQLKAVFEKHPERWVELALLHIWDAVALDYRYDNLLRTPLADYNAPFLKMLAPTTQLKEFFNREADFVEQYELGFELCERGELDVVVNKAYERGNGSLRNDQNLAVGLYDMAINKDKAVSLGGAVYCNAAYLHGVVCNWQRVTQLGEIALTKGNGDPVLCDLMAKIYLKFANPQRAEELKKESEELKKNPKTAERGPQPVFNEIPMDGVAESDDSDESHDSDDRGESRERPHDH